MAEECVWSTLAPSVLANIFSHLSYNDLINAGQVCSMWADVLYDDYMWKESLSRTMETSEIIRRPTATTWKGECKRVYQETPAILHETLTGRSTDSQSEVIYACFSSDGSMLATCSMDKHVCVWRIGENKSVRVQAFDVQSKLKIQLSYMEFSPDAKHIIVVCPILESSIGVRPGYVYVIGLAYHNRVELDCMILVEPFDVFATWCGDGFITGSLETDHLNTTTISTFYIHNTDNSRNKVLFRFQNVNNCYVRSAMVAKRPNTDDLYFIFTTGYLIGVPHQIGIKHLPADAILLGNEGEDEREIDVPDRLFDLGGFIIGCSLSPDHKQLYINCRPWTRLDNDELAYTSKTPVNMHIIDIDTLTNRGIVYYGAANGQEDGGIVYMLFPDVSENYVASGEDDGHACVLDRYYHKRVRRLYQGTILSRVVFNPRNQGMLVTIGHDNKVNIWRSRHSLNRLGRYNKEEE